MNPISIASFTHEEEIVKALSLVWNVFLQYEAPDYAQEGIDEFYTSIHDPVFLNKLTFYAAYQENKMLGVLATRNGGSHIALFFVEGMYHHQGIGKALFQEALQHNTAPFMTVNASPYAVPVYHKLGFQDTDSEQVVHGLKFTPMKRENQ